MNKLLTIQITLLGLIDYILDMIELTTGNQQDPADRHQTRQALLATINTNLSAELLSNPQISQNMAAIFSDPKPEENFTQNLEKLTQNNTLEQEQIDLPQLLTSHSQVVLIEFTEKTIPNSEKLVAVIKKIITKASK